MSIIRIPVYFLDPSSKLRVYKSIEIKMSSFLRNSIVTITHYAYPNFSNKRINIFECKYEIISFNLLVFVDANEDSIMVDDVVMPLNSPIAPIEEEKLEETLLNVNVSQWLHKKELLKRMMHTQIDHSTWDH